MDPDISQQMAQNQQMAQSQQLAQSQQMAQSQQLSQNPNPSQQQINQISRNDAQMAQMMSQQNVSISGVLFEAVLLRFLDSF